MAETVLLLLGSNLGIRITNLENAISEIASQCGNVSKISGIYESKSWGITDLPDYLNLAIELKTDFSPDELLFHLKKIEKYLGRENADRWHSRIIDIDIIFYNDLIYKTIDLEIPHKEVINRRFALVPMEEIVPFYEHPVYKKTIKNLLADCLDNSIVTQFENS